MKISGKTTSAAITQMKAGTSRAQPRAIDIASRITSARNPMAHAQ